MRYLAPTLLALALAACTSDSLTQVVVVVVPEPGILLQSQSVAIRVSSAPDANSGLPETVLDIPSAPWNAGQFTVVLSPKSPDRAGRYLLEASALRDSLPIATVRLSSSYVVGQTRYVRLVLEDACLHVACDVTSTCHAGACASASADPSTFSRGIDEAPTLSPTASSTATDAGPPADGREDAATQGAVGPGDAAFQGSDGPADATVQQPGATVDAAVQQPGATVDAAVQQSGATVDAAVQQSDGAVEVDAGMASGPNLTRDAGMPTPVVAPADAAVPPTPPPVMPPIVPVQDAGSPICQGTTEFSLCWHLGPQGASCLNTCDAHGGYDVRTVAYVGTTLQGGSLALCQQILQKLGVETPPIQGMRMDTFGLGCHLWSTGVSYWLNDIAFDPATAVTDARVACACKR